MGTISSRKRKDGSTSHTAQIRIMREGVKVYQESQTFDRKPAAKAWVKKREAELAQPGALERLSRKGVALRDIIEHYIAEQDKIELLARTRRATLRAIGRTWLGDVVDRDITSQVLVDYVLWRMSPEGGGVAPQTTSNDLSHLSSVLNVARPAWGYDIDLHAMGDARRVLRGMRVRTKGKQRDRRPELSELDLLLQHFFMASARRPSSTNMPKVLGFALYSARRQDEIVRIRWDDLDEENQRVLVRDMKNPGQTIGNNVWCHLPDEAWAILQSMPRVCPEIFPYTAGNVSINFTRACQFFGIEDLHFHDLRHEGISRLFEMGWDIPRVSSVSGHRSWASLQRYTHLRKQGDKFEGWEWLDRIIELPAVIGYRRERPSRR